MKQASLLGDSKPSKDRIAYIDGGSRGNPGPAGYGVVIQDADGKTVDTLSQSIGKATNNVAEYQALLGALEYVLGHDASRLKVYCDSELIVRQMQGRYRVQSPDLIPLHRRARELAGKLERFTIQHIPREQNSEADQLANEAMDRARSGAPSPAPAATLALVAICENGLLRPLGSSPPLEEGAEYELQLRRRR